ncbi:Hypothetical protein ABNV54_02404 [Enterococcus faecalis]
MGPFFDKNNNKKLHKKENGMNQKKKPLFAIALCGSLLISSLNGIPAIAETMGYSREDVQNVVFR